MSSTGAKAQHRAEARIGCVLRGKWRLDSVLGVGGLSVVYAATSAEGKRVAVKVLHPELSVYEEIRSRFQREALVARRIGHPGVVSVLDDDVTEDGEPYLVMDLLEGQTLNSLRKRRGGMLEPSFVLMVADAALDVLAAIHEKDVIHRDLKPENLFYTNDRQVKVLDFGIARLHDQSACDPAIKTGMAMGTPGFMPPEQAQGRWDMVDARSDIWALGATMFTLVTGHKVHGEYTMSEALAAAIKRKAPPLRSVALWAPEAVAIVIDRALEFEASERWPDARTMRRSVQGAREALGVSSC